MSIFISRLPDQVSTPLAIGVCVALFAGFGGRTPLQSTTTRPDVRPTANPVPTGPYTINGVVVDESGRPVAGASFDACCIDGGTYSHWHVQDRLLTNESGKFQMTGIPAVSLWFRTSKDGYLQQCAGTATVQGDVAITLALVAKANLTLIAPSAPGLRSLSGTVVQQTDTGKQPVAGALVLWSEVEDFEPAMTYTDSAGRFALCGLPTDQTLAIAASGDFRNGYTDVPPGPTGTNVEIVVR